MMWCYFNVCYNKQAGLLQVLKKKKKFAAFCIFQPDKTHPKPGQFEVHRVIETSRLNEGSFMERILV